MLACLIIRIHIHPATGPRSDVEFHSQLDRALKDGYVKIKAAKCGVSGPPGSGKTHFKALFAGRERPTCKDGRQSTAVSTEAVQITPDFVEELVEMHRIQDGSKVRWYAIDSKKIALLIANTLYVDKIRRPSTTHIDQTRKMSKSRNQVLMNLKKLIQRNLKRNPKSLKGMRILYLVDTGGQPQFQEIMPIFVRNSSVHFLVHKLTESLDECPPFDYKIDGIKYSVPEEMLISNRDYIKQSLHSISSCVFARSIKCRVSSGIPKPQFAVIGMFKDQCSDKDLEDKQKSVNDCIVPFAGKCEAFYRPHHTEKPVFAVDGSKDGWSTNGAVIDDLHVKIEAFTKSLEIEVPIRWFPFLNILKDHSRTKPFLTLQQCCEIAQEEDIMMDEEQDVEDALEFFDELGLIVYFSKFLHNIVFISPKFLFKKISEIIVQSFDCAALTEITNQERLDFHQTGIFSRSMMETVKSLQEDFDSNFNLDDLLTLLKKLCIIADVGSCRYFIPCVLAYERDEENSKFLKDIQCHMIANKTEPLLISFPDDYSPRGLFCASVTYLAERCNWKIESSSRKLEHKRNLIEFDVYEHIQDENLDIPRTSMGQVVIVDRMSRFEVYSTCDKKHLCGIRRTINKAVWYAAAQCLTYSPENIDASIGFSCDIDCGKPKPHGTVVCDDDSPHWSMKCIKNRSKRARKLNDRQLPWFTNSDECELAI